MTVLIDRIGPNFRVEYNFGELSISFDYDDPDGDRATAHITAFAIRDLAEKLNDAHEVVLDKLTDRNVGFSVTVQQEVSQ